VVVSPSTDPEIVTQPPFFAVTIAFAAPLGATLTTEGSLLDHETVRSLSSLPLLSRTTAAISAVEPIWMRGDRVLRKTALACPVEGNGVGSLMSELQALAAPTTATSATDRKNENFMGTPDWCSA
jgi:hypothetical protein